MVRFGDPKSDNNKRKNKGNKAQKKALAITEVLGQPVSIKKFEVFHLLIFHLKIFIIKIYVKILKVHGINHIEEHKEISYLMNTLNI